MRRLLLCLALLSVAAATPAAASVYHVRDGGLRLAGPSQPGDWSLANCYADPATALAAAAAPDSILLHPGEYTVSAPLDLVSFLGQRSLAGEPDSCLIRLSDDGRLSPGGTVQNLLVRGITFQGVEPASLQPALRIANAGGALQQVTVESCVFRDLRGGNGSDGGAALQALETIQEVDLALQDCLFRGCTSSGKGGAIFLQGGYQVSMLGCDLIANGTAAGGTVPGGALAAYPVKEPITISLASCRLDSNRSGGPGGAIAAEYANLSLQECDIRWNRSDHEGLSNWGAGAGIFLRGTRDETSAYNVVLDRCQILGNEVNLEQDLTAGDGGGMLARGFQGEPQVRVHVLDCEFAENFAIQAGGLYIGRFCTGLVERTSFRDNVAAENGGGAWKGGSSYANGGETARFEYCEFLGNRAGYDHQGPTLLAGNGGAFMTRRYPRGEFVNCTFRDNVCGIDQGEGDAIFHYAEGASFGDSIMRCELTNCLFYGENGEDVQVRASAPDGFTLISHCAYAEGELACEGVLPQASILLTESPFASPSDQRLRVGSDCIDAALNLGYALDIERNPVPLGDGPDVGAYEKDPLTSMPAAAVGARLIGAWPNPTNPSTSIQLELAQAAEARLEIYDLRGQRLRLLLHRPLPAGRHAVRWDGRDTTGRFCAAGSYLAVLRAGGARDSRKITLVR
jgi:hypothetical protein